MKMVDFSAETPYACQKNYKIFQAAVNKLNLPIVWVLAGSLHLGG